MLSRNTENDILNCALDFRKCIANQNIPTGIVRSGPGLIVLRPNGRPDCHVSRLVFVPAIVLGSESRNLEVGTSRIGMTTTQALAESWDRNTKITRTTVHLLPHPFGPPTPDEYNEE